MEIELKNEFEIIVEGTEYSVPEYKVIDGVGLKATGNNLPVKFVRGSKQKSDEVEPKQGTLHEHLLSVMIHDLKFKNSLVPSREGSLAITKLEEAYLWMVQRQVDRKKREVDGTYKK